MRKRAQEYLIWIGLIGALVYALAFIMLMRMVPPMSPKLPPAAIAAIYSEHNKTLLVDAIIMMATAGFWLPIGAVISMQMRRHETGFPIWTLLQAMASTLGALFFALPVLFWYVTGFTAERNPEITATFNELSWLTFLTPIAAFTLQLLPMIVIGFTSDVDGPYTAFPRWMSYLTIWMIGMGDIPVLAILFKSGPFAWNGVVGFWCPALGYSVWITALALVLLRAIRHQADELGAQTPTTLESTATR